MESKKSNCDQKTKIKKKIENKKLNTTYILGKTRTKNLLQKFKKIIYNLSFLIIYKKNINF